MGILLIALCVSGEMAAQGQPFDLTVRSTVYSSKETLPFWLHTNLDGIVDHSSANWINEIDFKSQLYEKSHFSVTTGAHLISRISDNSTTLFSELYLHANYGGFRLSAGRYADPIGLNNHELSVGSMLISRNATPIPKISISTPDFLNVPLTAGALQYKGMYSHGWLEENRFVRNAFLHQKYLYLKMNIGNFAAIAGISHNVIWGGDHPEFGALGGSNPLKNYVDVILGKGADLAGRSSADLPNEVIGNSVAAYDLGIEYDTPVFTLSASRLFYLEAKASTGFRNPWDGVWGINLTFKKRNAILTAIVYEHIFTRWQDNNDIFTIGSASYYDNGIFKSGWTYENSILGLPLIKYDPERETDRITNSLLIGHHLGLNGRIIKPLGYKLFATYSRNYGTNPDNIPNDELNLRERRLDQYSVLLLFSYTPAAFEAITIHAGVAGDRGELLADNIGTILGVRWKMY